MPPSRDALAALAAQVGQLLLERGWTLGIAESCTGGLVCDAITDISGSSRYLLGGVIAYANSAKRDLLRVPEELLAAHGAVSREVAEAMARGVCCATGSQVGLATTGIAGPTGGTPDKPVGTVYVALCSPEGSWAEHHRWEDDRRGNKRRSAEAVLSLALRRLARRGGGPRSPAG